MVNVFCLKLKSLCAFIHHTGQHCSMSGEADHSLEVISMNNVSISCSDLQRQVKYRHKVLQGTLY